MPESNLNSVIYFIHDTLLSNQNSRPDGHKLMARALNFNVIIRLHESLPLLDENWIAFLFHNNEYKLKEFYSYLERHGARAEMAFSGPRHGAIDLESLLSVVFPQKKVKELLSHPLEVEADKAALTHALRSQFGEFEILISTAFRFV